MADVHTLVNLTPHPVVVAGTTISPEPVSARCLETSRRVGECLGVTLVVKDYGDIVGLPEPESGVVYIASSMVAQAAWRKGRYDVVCPGDAIRDNQGRIVGCASLCTGPNFGGF